MADIPCRGGAPNKRLHYHDHTQAAAVTNCNRRARCCAVSYCRSQGTHRTQAGLPNVGDTIVDASPYTDPRSTSSTEVGAPDGGARPERPTVPTRKTRYNDTSNIASGVPMDPGMSYEICVRLYLINQRTLLTIIARRDGLRPSARTWN